MQGYTQERTAFLQDDKDQIPPPGVVWFDRQPPDKMLNHPVTNVTWQQAMEYCEWLSQKTQRNYTLPSEAEWEKAARGPDSALYPWGNEWCEECCDCESNTTTPVITPDSHGPFHPLGRSFYGCYDMLGNVQEWTRTIWGKSRKNPRYTYPYDANDGRESVTDDPDLYRVYRGGSFKDNRAKLRCSVRGRVKAKLASMGRGFRVMLQIEPTE